MFSPISRTEIARKIGLSITAVSKYTNLFIAEGLVEELGTQDSKGGRKATSLGLDNNYGCTLAIDFGHTFLRFGIMDMRNNIIVKETHKRKDLGEHQTGLPMLIRLAKDFLARSQPECPLLAVCIAPSSIIHSRTNKITFPNLSGWKNVDILSPLSENFPVPVFCDDSARMMALAECTIAGNGRERQLVFVNVGDGIGTGIVANGRPLRGTGGYAGEMAHIIVKENGYPCDCGSSGCLEQYTSVFAMVRNARKAIRDGVNSKIKEYANGDVDSIDSTCIAKAYSDSDKLAIQLLSEACSYLSVGIANVINILNPPILVLGGGGMNLSKHMIDGIRHETLLRTLTASFNDTDVRLSRFGDNSVLIGSSIYMLDKLFGFDELCEDNEFFIHKG